jgi:hypothetical protein
VDPFPIGFSNPPPLGGKTTAGKDAFTELSSAGASLIRIGRPDWNMARIDGQLKETDRWLNAAKAKGLQCWLWLGELPNLPAQANSPQEQLLRKIVNHVKGHPGLGAYKGIDEPHNKFRPQPVDPKGMVRAYKLVKRLDPKRPLVVIHEPESSVAELKPYTAACDIVGADIYPISYPPGTHAGKSSSNTDLSLVGELTRRMKQVAGRKAVWMTLQIAWSGVTPSQERPEIVPRFPSLFDERFMAYEAIAAGARGLFFFGGHLTQIARGADADAGWNWTFWERVMRPLLGELRSTAVGPALVAPPAKATIRSTSRDVEVAARQTQQFIYVIAVRTGGSTTRVGFTGLPAKHNGKPINGGQVLFEYTQSPLAPPIEPGHQEFRSVGVSKGAFRDWFGAHDVHVYRFPRS